jgi:hypothetical protein
MSASTNQGTGAPAFEFFELCSDFHTYARFRIHPLGFLSRGRLSRESGCHPVSKVIYELVAVPSLEERGRASVPFPPTSIFCVLDCGQSSLKIILT